MAPEHVEGRPLDFRTDVFSVGILLYQLSTGELPFKGRNPHEILKRIAECRFLDARVVNPLVSDRLNAILKRALARLPDERYADIGLVVEDLEAFLAEVELGETRVELARFFREPLPYERSLRERLVATLARRGKEELAARRTARALELWNRVLTIDPANGEVLRLIDRLSRRRRVRWGLVTGVGLIAASSAVALTWTQVDGSPVPATVALPVSEAPSIPPPPPVTTPAVTATEPEPDAGIVVEIEPEPEPEPAVNRPREREKTIAASTRTVTPRATPAIAKRTFRLVTMPKNASYSVDGGEFRQISMGGADVTVGPGAHRIVFRQPLCQEVERTIQADDIPSEPMVVRLPWKPARVGVSCERATAITINGRPLGHGGAADILDFNKDAAARVVVEFLVEGRTQTKRVWVRAGDDPLVITCDER
jgi:serine/threonine-protein kinase